ncbi:MAG: tetratricopeptide repeat protein [Candidatus Eremiobacteraeota bacterium]|nr:tetratricopeptide repeat protein [Candidatus Eremiobacteraeota bacterium]
MRAILLMMLLTAWGLADTPDELYSQANDAYLKGAYSRSAELYRKSLEAGESGEVLYNLGNAYYQLEDLGRARVAYEKARLYRPRDRNLTHNLALLRSKLSDTEPPEDGLTRLVRLATENELAGAVLFFNLATVMLVLLYRRQGREALAWGAVASLVVLLLLVALLSWKELGPGAHRAVVVSALAQVKNGPGREFTDSLTLHSGTAVTVLDERGDWFAILALGRIQGWVRREQVETI